jgi:hypothetical protein
MKFVWHLFSDAQASRLRAAFSFVHADMPADWHPLVGSAHDSLHFRFNLSQGCI